MKSYACHANDAMDSDVAFLAGIAFAFQFSNEAMRERLCEEHQATLVRASAGAVAAVPPSARRVSPT